MTDSTFPIGNLSTAATDPAPLIVPARNWYRWLGLGISVAILVGAFGEFNQFEIRADLHHIPMNPTFWIAFTLYYFSTPLWEWVLYRRLWSIPVTGFIALLRKNISNELLLGYLGEVDFYGWARRQGRLIAAPFGAIKDVAILSAVCGNAVTLAMLPLAIRLLRSLSPGIDQRLLAVSIAAYVAISLLPILLRRRLFSLPRAMLWYVARIQLGRIVLSILLYACLWHLVLPNVAFGWWFMLATLRQLVSHLPLVPYKEALFAGIAVFFLGRETEIAALLALLASFTLMLHIAIGLVLATVGLVEQSKIR